MHAAPPNEDVTTYAGFLRGVNVGGNRKLPMAELRAYLTDLGARDVHTYIQSGNVVFRVAPEAFPALREAFEARAEDRFGYDLAWATRSAEQLARVVRDNPFLADAAADPDPKHLHVGFLDREPDPAAVAALPPSPSPPDDYRVRGGEVYFLFPDGVGRSRLANGKTFDRLGANLTVRNWRTVLTMLDMATQPAM
ncbi:MAG: DUF1697 domain-containing protein [Trueperaceae bacterium]